MRAGDYSESLIVHFRRVEMLRQEALSLKAIDLSPRQLADVELLLNRGMYPLDGFMQQKDYESVLDGMRLIDGTVFPIPVYLDIPKKRQRAFPLGNVLP